MRFTHFWPGMWNNRPSFMLTLKWIVLIAVVGWGGIVMLAYFAQRALMYFPETVRTPPAAAGFSQAEEVVLQTEDGEKIIAWHVPPRGDNPVVLYFHGNGGALSWRADRFRALMADGTGPLADQRPVLLRSADRRRARAGAGAPWRTRQHRPDRARRKALRADPGPQAIRALCRRRPQRSRPLRGRADGAGVPRQDLRRSQGDVRAGSEGSVGPTVLPPRGISRRRYRPANEGERGAPIRAGGLGLLGSRPSRCARLRASLRARRMASARSRAFFSEGFS